MRQYEEFDKPQRESKGVKSYTWMDACLMLVQSPGIETFKRILADSSFTAQRSFFWVFMSGVLFGVALAPAYPINELIGVLLLGIPSTEIEATAYQPDLLTIVLVGSIVGGIYAVIGFIMQTWLLQRVGKILNATGDYYDMFKLRGIYFPIILVLRALIVVTLGLSSPLAMILIFGTLFLDLVYSALAMGAANNVTWRQGLLMVAGMNLGIIVALFLFSSFRMG